MKQRSYRSSASSMTMMETSASARAYRCTTAAVAAVACFIFGSAAAFNPSSSLLVPSTLSTRSNGGNYYHRRHHHLRLAGRIGSSNNLVKEELVLGSAVLFASAYNDEATATTGAAAAATTTTTTMPSSPTATIVLNDSDTTETLDNAAIITASGDINCHDDDTTETEMQPQSVSKTTTSSSTTTLSTSSHSHLIAPTIPKILRYTIPAIGIWLCSPVLSMIDTASVGLLSGTAQQAALNPAASVTDCGALVVAFMYTATTNLIAAAVREDADEEEEELAQYAASSSALTASTTTTGEKHQHHPVTRQPKTTKTLLTAFKLAFLVGTTFATTLMCTGPYLLHLLMGGVTDPIVYNAALRYVRIRSLGMPAMVVIGTAQSACLGMQDVKSPLYVLLAAAVINFLGDVALVPLKNDWWGGAAGAAWATVASQYAALVFFARWLTMKKSENATTTDVISSDSDDDAMIDSKRMPLFWKKKGRNDNNMTTTPTAEMIANHGDNTVGLTMSADPLPLSVSAATTTAGMRTTIDDGNSQLHRHRQQQQTQLTPSSPEQTTTSQTKIRGFLSNSQLTLRSFLSLHNLDKNKVKEFFPFVIPVTTTSIGRISGYIAMSHVAASTLGTYDMAGHQIILSIFCCITPFVDALSQVAQSFVPAVFGAKERTQERANALRKTVNNFRLVGLGFGGVLVSLVACIPLISRYFTTDLVVLERVHSAIAPVGLFMLVNGLMCAGEGTLLGQKDLKFLRNMYAIFFFTVPAYMLRLKHRALTGVQTVGVATMWTAFSMYNVIRASSFHLRLAQLQRRTDRGVKNDAA